MFYGEDLFSTASRGLENANAAGFDNIEAGTRIAFAEDQFAAGVVLGNSTISQDLEFRLRELGKHGNTSQNRGSCGPGLRHVGILCDSSPHLEAARSDLGRYYRRMTNCDG